MPQIAPIANLWSLVGHPSPRTEWSLAKKIAAVAAAGFEGITCRLTPEHRRLAEEQGLRHLLGFVSSSDPSEFDTALRAQKEGGAVQINVQLDDHDTPPALAAKHWLQLIRIAEKIGGLVPSLEVHRDTCTETPEKVYEIADLYKKATGKKIRFCWDFSHISVVKHLYPPYADRLIERPDLFQNSEQYHMRPFNGHHCQVPVTYRGKLTPEIISYLEFARTSLKLWKSAPTNRAKTLFVCPEMGPYRPDGSGYNITGLPPAWPDAVVLRGELTKAWRKA